MENTNNDIEKADFNDIDKSLELIEQKYFPKPLNTNVNKNLTYLEELTILSKEFDTFGLPEIDLQQNVPKILLDVTKSAHFLVQLHRKTLSQMKDINISSQCKNTRNFELEKKIDLHKTRLNRFDEQNKLFKNNIIKLTNELNDSKKNEVNLKEELEKTKRYYKSKQDELVHEIKRVKNDNERLKRVFGQDVGKFVSKDDVMYKIIKEHKTDEEIYQKTIQKLEENNKELLNEILNLKEELALASCAIE